MKVSVIIPTKNRQDLLLQCLESVNQHCKNHQLEIIVVDTGDGASAEWALGYGYKAVHNPNATFAQATNQGVALSQHPWLWLLNNDVILTHDILQTWSEVTVDQDDIVGARLVYPNGLIQHAGVGFDNLGSPYHLWEQAPVEHPDAIKSRFLPAVTFACTLINRYCWMDLGGLDERYFNAYEDVDFCLRAREKGYAVFYDHKATAVHLTAQTEGRFERNQESLKHYQEQWVNTGRIYYVLGMWPFSRGE